MELRGRSPRATLLGALLLLIMSLVPARTLAVTTVITVNIEGGIDGDVGNVEALLADPGPDGGISWAEALHAVNLSGPGYTIRFDLPHGTTIPPCGSGACILTADYTTIDGDVDGDGRPDIVFLPPTGGEFLVIYASHTILRHLVFSGVRIDGRYGGGAHNVVEGSYIGTDVAGRAAFTRFGVRDLVYLGLTLGGDSHSNIVRDNVIAAHNVTRFDSNPERYAGLRILLSDDNVVQGNHIGVNIDGDPLGNAYGIVVYGGRGNRIGGSRASTACGFGTPCNVIGANGVGIGLRLGYDDLGLSRDPSHNRIEGNFIGVNQSGLVTRSNGIGISLREGAHENSIGGPRASQACDGPCNIISASLTYGVAITGTGTFSNTIQGNYIGLSVDGSTAFGSDVAGVYLAGQAQANLVGGDRGTSTACSGPCNLISGNEAGVLIVHAGTDDNHIQGNYIGTDPAGLAARPNRAGGIRIAELARGSLIGGDRGASAACTGPCNLISGNGRHGIELLGVEAQVLGNFVGVNGAGTLAVPNRLSGLLLETGARPLTIGGTKRSAACDGACNLLSGNLQHGVLITGTGTLTTTLRGNHIGVDAAGTAVVSNARDGIYVAAGTPPTVVGGARASTACEGPCNLIGGNLQYGVELLSAGHTIQGNFVGVSARGGALANGAGILVGAARNTIGGQRWTACDGLCNVIGGNLKHGVLITGTAALSNTVQGNNVGVGASGTITVPNQLSGIALANGARGTLVGGSRPTPSCVGPCNLIGGNLEHGVLLTGAGTSGNSVQGNHIGVGVTNTLALANGRAGVLIGAGASGNLVGSSSPSAPCRAACNLIRRNGGAGVSVVGQTTLNNRLRGNAIYDNGRLGVDLGDDGVTLNDPSDLDSGPNMRMNFPEELWSSYDPLSNTTRITGLLATPLPGTAVDVYGTRGVDASTFGEGEHYLGSALPDATGHFTLTLTGPLTPGLALSALATDAGGSTSEFARVCGDVDGNGNPDNDGDALCDDWETRGLDFNGDGAVDLTLPAMGASPNHKDLFVEVDYMRQGAHSHQPFPLALQDMARAFAGAPLTNPDGTTGIALHFVGAAGMVDEPVTEIISPSFALRGTGAADDFDDLKHGSNNLAQLGVPCGTRAIDGHFGTVDERRSANCSNILGAKRMAFRYVIFGHDQVDLPGASGMTELPGNDALITLGTFSAANILSVGGRRAVEAGTLMHEFGHALELHHGGRDERNCKPNYLSVMSYALQFPDVDLSRPLDYSRQVLPTLDETNLNELIGVGGPVTRSIVFGAPSPLPGGGFVGMLGPANGSVDWDGDGVLEASVAADISRNDVAGCGDEVPFDTMQDGLTTLVGAEDWSRLRYNFRTTRDYADGARLREGPVSELTRDQALAMARAVDADQDGLSNADDTCPARPNVDQADANGDGIGDACALGEIVVGTSSIFGGSSVAGTVTLLQGAPAGGAELQLYSSDERLATLPLSARVAPGATSATFSLSTAPVASSQALTISAAYGADVRELGLTLLPGAALQTLALSPAPVSGGASVSATLTLGQPVPAQGMRITLASSNPAVAAVPPEIMLAGGATGAQFLVRTSEVAEATSVTISATDQLQTLTATLALAPSGPAAPFSVATGLNAARLADGAEVVAVSSGAGSAQAALDDYEATAWVAAGGLSSSQWLQVRLAGPTPPVIGQVALRGMSYGGIKDFELRVSLSGTAPGDFTTVLSGTLPASTELHTFSFAPVQARYVELVIRNGWEGAWSTGISELRLLSRPHMGGVVSLSDGPASAIVGVSSQAAAGGAPQHLLDEDPNTSWLSASGQTTNQWVTVELSGGRTFTVDRVRLQSMIYQGRGVQDFEVRVSTTSSGPEAFTTIYTGRAANSDALQTFAFAPTPARYVQLIMRNNHGHSQTLGLTRLDVLTPEGANVARLKGSAAFVVGASSEAGATSSADQVLAFAPRWSWRTAAGQTTDQWIKLRLADGAPYQVDRLALRGPADASSPRGFELRVSTSGSADADFRTVFAGTLPNDGLLHWFTFPPALATYAQLVVRGNHGGASIQLQQLQLFSPELGAAMVAFDERSAGTASPAVAWRWDFGDGQTSSERHPTHRYAAPGRYLVRLTTTDAAGQARGASLPYTVLPPPRADFGWLPALPDEGQSVSFSDASRGVGASIVGWTWQLFPRIPPGPMTPQASTSFSDNGTYVVALSITDSQLLTSVVTRSVTVANVAPTVRVEDFTHWNMLVWGESRLTHAQVRDPGGNEALRCLYDFGDGATYSVPDCRSGDTTALHPYALPGVYTGTLTVTDKEGATAADQFAVFVDRRQTRLAITRGITVTDEGLVQVSARLDMASLDALYWNGGSPLAGKIITFKLRSQTVTATTDAGGVATAWLTFAPGGDNPLVASFAGDQLYLPAAHRTLEPGDIFLTSNVHQQWRGSDGTLAMPFMTHWRDGARLADFDAASSLAIATCEGVRRFSPRMVQGPGIMLPYVYSYGCPSALTFDAAGNLYLAYSHSSVANLRVFNREGALLREHTLRREIGSVSTVGPYAIDMAADQCTLFYATSGLQIMRFDVCTNTQLPNFNRAPLPDYTYVLRLLPDGGLLAASSSVIARLDAAGAVVQTYDAPGADTWVGVALDPDGSSFWAVDVMGPDVYRFDLRGGAVLRQFHAFLLPSNIGIFAGIAVYQEPRVSRPAPPRLQRIVLSPVVVSRDLGTTQTLRATVYNSAGAVVPGASVTLEVRGASPGHYHATTDISGTATFTHTGLAAGDDTVLAWNGWLASNSARVRWQGATPTPTDPAATTPTATSTATASPTATSTATRTSTAKPTATATPTVTSTASATATRTTTATSTTTASPTATSTATRASTAKPTATATPTVTSTASATATRTTTATSTTTASPTATSTATRASTATMTATASATSTSTSTASATSTSTSTASTTATHTTTRTASTTATSTATTTATQASTATASVTTSPPTTATASATATMTASPTATATATATTATASATRTASTTATSTASATATSTATTTATATSTDTTPATSTASPTPSATPGGFVTGGGWIESPAGAYPSRPEATGRASFGLIARYRPGAAVPGGRLQFNYLPSCLSFHSSSYTWLTISRGRAGLQGLGTVDGAGVYGFQLTLIDGGRAAGGPDRFRMRIWHAITGRVVYDNQLDQPLAGGQITIHRE